ncbi:6737_t:CDS:2 [Entrophospora sp. SA101]|nr:2721_t:CDS:2 [Entrophospora sp. SA101]CAJ0633357.1 6737_t:CDS:2 [Entrophospora sp. SA101]CAJ0827219.1 6251_t:CDS:2 [Entrophospora sp. SA101]CAJ0844197.1 6291_t:CDS:2 [Entrophospora sp. SA101]CAJ0909262.1 21761_t:CDS:2 [Entrophospora sp. SA101]
MFIPRLVLLIILKKICDLTKKYDVITFLDEVLDGPRGGGVAKHLYFDLNVHCPYAGSGSVLDKIDIISGTLSKTFANILQLRQLKECLAQLNIPVAPNPSHIVPILVGEEAETCKIASDQLLIE